MGVLRSLFFNTFTASQTWKDQTRYAAYICSKIAPRNPDRLLLPSQQNSTGGKKHQIPNEMIYEVRTTHDGRGQGLFATRELPPNIKFLSEAPIIQSNHVQSGGRFEAHEDLLQKYISLDLESRRWFHTLYDRYAEGDNPTIEGRWFTNCIPIQKNRFGVFKYTNKVNHSCSPNTAWQWNEQTGQLEGSTLRNIKRGEEITAGYYLGVKYENVLQRRRRLLHIFGFVCQCEQCISEALWPDIIKKFSCMYGLVWARGGWKEKWNFS